MNRAVRLELPFPPSGLNPNSRDGWRAKATVVADYREQCGWTAVATKSGAVSAQSLRLANFNLGGRFKLPMRPPVEATVTFVVPDRRKRDEDNLLAMLKPAWDGLVDSGLLVGDDHANFKVVKTEVVVRHDRWVPVAGSRLIAKSQPCVIVELVSRVGAGP